MDGPALPARPDESLGSIEGRKSGNVIRVALGVIAVVLLAALVGLALQTTATAKVRKERQALRAELEANREDLSAAQGELAESQSNLTDAIGESSRLQQKLNATRNRVRFEHRRYLREVRRSEGLATVGAQAMLAVEAKAACLDVVLDAYNQYYYYEDIGIALEGALDSQACARAGIT